MLLSEAVDEYLRLKKARDKGQTIANDASTTRRLLAHVGNIQLRNLQQQHIESFFYAPCQHDADEKHDDVRCGQQQRTAPSSFNTTRSRVTSFLRFCIGRGYLRRDLMMNVRHVRTGDAERQRLTPQQLLALLDECTHPRDRAMIAIAINTAMRAGEITSLRVGDLDLQEGWLKVYVQKSSTWDRRPITSDLDAEMRQWLLYYTAERGALNPDWYLTPSKCGFRWYTGDDGTRKDDGTQRLRPDMRMTRPYNVVQRAMSKLDLKTHGEGFHTVRRSVARIYFETLRAEGYDGALQATKSLLNHKNASVTEHYLGLTMERQKRDISLRGLPFLTALVTAENVVPLRREGGLSRG